MRRLLIIVISLLSVLAATALAPPANGAPANALTQSVTTAGRAPAPVVKSIKPATGGLLGGDVVTISGKNFTPKTVVRFGAERADITSRTAKKLVVTSPAGIEGPIKVSVKAGKKSAKKKPTFTYQAPADVDTAELDAAAGTFEPEVVDWVSGGPDVDDPDAGTDYTVGLPAGAQVPSNGHRFLLRPGGTVYPSGLAGTVSEVAFQEDGSVRVTVTPSALEDVFDEIVVDYSGEPQTPDGRRASSVSFADLGRSAFECEDSDGSRVSFAGSLDLRFENLRPDFYFHGGGLFSSPTLDAYVAGSAVIEGKVSVTGNIDCALRDSWVNAHRRVIPIGTSGATVSFAPQASFSLSATGTVKVTQTTRFMYGLTKFDDQPFRAIRVARADAPVLSASASAHVEMQIGVAVRVGFLDRIGVEVTAGLVADGQFNARSGQPPKVCGDFTLSFRITVSGFLDVWVKEWTVEVGGPFNIQLAAFHACSSPEQGLPPETGPVITTTDLPDAAIGKDYSAALETEDGRFGAWSITGGSFPPGLALASDGTVSGRPTAGIGTRSVSVRFVDEEGEQDSAVIRLRVLPSDGLGGGAIQATLTWDSDPDLDLHAFEPDGNEIYYGNRGPSANGGELDHDSNVGCGDNGPVVAENIRWNGETTAHGRYEFFVDTYSACSGDLGWHLTVRVAGEVVIDEDGNGDSTGYVLNYGDSGLRVREVDATRHLGTAPK